MVGLEPEPPEGSPVQRHKPVAEVAEERAGITVLPSPNTRKKQSCQELAGLAFGLTIRKWESAGHRLKFIKPEWKQQQTKTFCQLI